MTKKFLLLQNREMAKKFFISVWQHGRISIITNTICHSQFLQEHLFDVYYTLRKKEKCITEFDLFYLFIYRLLLEKKWLKKYFFFKSQLLHFKNRLQTLFNKNVNSGFINAKEREYLSRDGVTFLHFCFYLLPYLCFTFLFHCEFAIRLFKKRSLLIGETQRKAI